MSKTTMGKKGRGKAKVTTSRPQVTNGRKAPPALKRPMHLPTPQEQAYYRYLCGSEAKLPVEEADFRLVRPGAKDLVWNLKFLPEAGIRKAAEGLTGKARGGRRGSMPGWRPNCRPATGDFTGGFPRALHWWRHTAGPYCAASVEPVRMADLSCCRPTSAPATGSFVIGGRSSST